MLDTLNINIEVVDTDHLRYSEIFDLIHKFSADRVKNGETGDIARSNFVYKGHIYDVSLNIGDKVTYTIVGTNFQVAEKSYGTKFIDAFREHLVCAHTFVVTDNYWKRCTVCGKIEPVGDSSMFTESATNTEFKVNTPVSIMTLTDKDSKEVLRFEQNGDIFIHGELVTKSDEVVQGFKMFLKDRDYIK